MKSRPGKSLINSELSALGFIVVMVQKACLGQVDNLYLLSLTQSSLIGPKTGACTVHQVHLLYAENMPSLECQMQTFLSIGQCAICSWIFRP